MFDHVLADVGDEQSIEMSLSTFSAHLRNIVAILDAATGRSLVLLDELAAGTDPVEGSALAQALLARLARPGAADGRDDALRRAEGVGERDRRRRQRRDRASTPTRHAPLYRLTLGRPGTSHALRTAERLGLDADVVEAARAPRRARRGCAPPSCSPRPRRPSARPSRSATARARERGRGERPRRARAREREAELTAEIERVRASARERARGGALAEAERDLAGRGPSWTRCASEIRAARRRERERRADAGPTRPRASATAGSAPPPSGPCAPSRRCARSARRSRRRRSRPATRSRRRTSGVRGTIAAIEGDTAEVIGPGGVRLRIPLARPAPVGGAPEPAEPEPAVRVIASARGDVSDQIDVRGMRAQEAREAVRAFVDDAALAGLPEVRVVHGRGTGAVRAAVREELTSHTLVDRHEPDSPTARRSRTSASAADASTAQTSRQPTGTTRITEPSTNGDPCRRGSRAGPRPRCRPTSRRPPLSSPR